MLLGQLCPTISYKDILSNSWEFHTSTLLSCILKRVKNSQFWNKTSKSYCQSFIGFWDETLVSPWFLKYVDSWKLGNQFKMI